MPPFPKPRFDYDYVLGDQIEAVRKHRDTAPERKIPKKTKSSILIASWNIANLGVQQRRDKDYRLIAEIISWFDLVAVQEVNDDLSGLESVLQQLKQAAPGCAYRTVFSDKGGNDERLAYVFDANKVQLLDMVGELAIPPAQHRFITLPGVSRKFTGFDRNPYVAAFKCRGFRFTLANVHLYFGGESKADLDRRSLETYAIGRWAHLRRDDVHAYTDNIIALGDFNMPKAKPGDPIYNALTKRGLHLPDHTSKVGSNLAGDSHYDQIAFVPGVKDQEFTGQHGMFDFDGGLFADLYQSHTNKQFRAFTKYYISDHRPLWARFKT